MVRYINLTYKDEEKFFKLLGLKTRLQISRRESISWEDFFEMLRINFERKFSDINKNKSTKIEHD